MDRSQVESEIKLSLSLSVAEKRLMENVLVANENVVAIIQQTSRKAVCLSIAQLDELADTLSAKANETAHRVIQRRLDTLVRKIDRLTGSHLQGLLESHAPGDQSVGSHKPK